MANPVTILVVDQSKESQELWAETLPNACLGCKVEKALTGESALECLEQVKINLIVASWELAPMSCVALMQRIREKPKAMHIPILLFAGRLSDRDRALAREFDIPDFLIAPFDESKVEDKISRMLKKESELDTIEKNLRKVESWNREGRVSESLSLISACLKRGPHAAKAHCLYGETWLIAEKYDQAVKAFEASLRYDSDFSRSRTGLAKAYLKIGNFDEAMKIFESLQKAIPGNIARMVSMGNAYLDHGDELKAEKIFTQAREVDRGHQDVSEGLGKIEFNRGNIAAASAFFRASGKGEELASYYNGMAIALVSKGDFDKAIKLYRDAIQAVPKSSKESLLHFNIGLAYKKGGQVAEAANSFARALISNPGYLKALSGLVNCARTAESKGMAYDKSLAGEALKSHKTFRDNAKKAS